MVTRRGVGSRCRRKQTAAAPPPPPPPPAGRCTICVLPSDDAVMGLAAVERRRDSARKAHKLVEFPLFRRQNREIRKRAGCANEHCAGRAIEGRQRLDRRHHHHLCAHPAEVAPFKCPAPPKTASGLLYYGAACVETFERQLAMTPDRLFRIELILFCFFSKSAHFRNATGQ